MKILKMNQSDNVVFWIGFPASNDIESLFFLCKKIKGFLVGVVYNSLCLASFCSKTHLEQFGPYFLPEGGLNSSFIAQFYV